MREAEVRGPGAGEEPVLGRDLGLEIPLARYLTQSVVVFDQDGLATGFLGPPGGLLGHGGSATRFTEFCHPDDLPLLLQVWAEGRDAPNGWVVGGRLRLRRGDGRWGWYRAELWNQLGVPGVDGLVVVTSPIPPDTVSEGIRTVEELLGELEPSVAAAAGLSSLTLDGNGVIRWATPQAEQLVGAGRRLVGRHLVDLMTDTSRQVVLGHLAGLEPGDDRTVLAEVLTDDGQEIGVELRLIGGVAHHRFGESVDELLGRADHAMYANKRRRRERG